MCRSRPLYEPLPTGQAAKAGFELHHGCSAAALQHCLTIPLCPCCHCAAVAMRDFCYQKVCPAAGSRVCAAEHVPAP